MSERLEVEEYWRILVVDDRPEFGPVVAGYAEGFTVQLRQATDLSAAIREVARWRPHLIILDLHMPRDDKWEPLAHLNAKYDPTQKSLAFCEQVTSHPQLRSILVAVVSVEDQPAQIQLAHQAGARAFFTKGKNFGVEELEELLEEVSAIHQIPVP